MGNEVAFTPNSFKHALRQGVPDLGDTIQVGSRDVRVVRVDSSLQGGGIRHFVVGHHWEEERCHEEFVIIWAHEIEGFRENAPSWYEFPEDGFEEE